VIHELLDFDLTKASNALEISLYFPNILINECLELILGLILRKGAASESLLQYGILYLQIVDSDVAFLESFCHYF